MNRSLRLVGNDVRGGPLGGVDRDDARRWAVGDDVALAGVEPGQANAATIPVQRDPHLPKVDLYAQLNLQVKLAAGRSQGGPEQS